MDDETRLDSTRRNRVRDGPRQPGTSPARIQKSNEKWRAPDFDWRPPWSGAIPKESSIEGSRHLRSPAMAHPEEKKGGRVHGLASHGALDDDTDAEIESGTLRDLPPEKGHRNNYSYRLSGQPCRCRKEY